MAVTCRRADYVALLHYRIEQIGGSGQLGQTDHLVARADFEGVAAHGVAVARQIVRETVHAVLEVGFSVEAGRDAPHPESVIDAVAAV